MTGDKLRGHVSWTAGSPLLTTNPDSRGIGCYETYFPLSLLLPMQDYALSPQSNQRKGGLLCLAAAAVGLGDHAAPFLQVQFLLCV